MSASPGRLAPAGSASPFTLAERHTMPSYIKIIAPHRLKAIIEEETRAGRREQFAEKLLQLLSLTSSLASRGDPERSEPECRALLIPCHSEREAEIAWGVSAEPFSNVFSPEHGERHIMNGGLIRHSDLKWSNHT